MDLNRYLRNLGFISPCVCPFPLSLAMTVILQNQLLLPSAAGVGLLVVGKTLEAQCSSDEATQCWGYVPLCTSYVLQLNKSYAHICSEATLHGMLSVFSDEFPMYFQAQILPLKELLSPGV